MPLWVSDFLGDTLDLDASEIGAYMLLLMAQWNRHGESLPDDETRLRRIARCGKAWPRVWANISRYFTKDADGLFSKRLRLEAQKVALNVEANRLREGRGGTAKALKSKERDLLDATLQAHSNPTSYNHNYNHNRSQHEHDHDARDSPEIITFRERILIAMGVDRSGHTGPGGKMLGTPADMDVARRWLDLPKITPTIIFEEVYRVMLIKPGGLPSNFRYFTTGMAALSGALSAPDLQPDTESPHGRPQKRPSGRDAETLTRIAEEVVRRRAKRRREAGGREK